MVSCALRLKEGIYKQFKSLKRGNWKGYPGLGNPHQHFQHRNHYWKLVLIESPQPLGIMMLPGEDLVVLGQQK